MTYVELHAHSAYSFLDGASLPEELVVRAAELGHTALALTDHDGVYGSLEFAHAAKAFGVHPITGAEVTLADGSHVTLLAETAAGYANLCRLLTEAHAGTRLRGRADRSPGRTCRDPQPHVPRRLRAGAARQPRGGSRRTCRDARSFSGGPRRGGEDGRARGAARVRPHPGARLPLSRFLGQGRSGHSPAQKDLRSSIRRS